MLAFVRVFAFYIGTAALLTWGLFALGWADALEMDGFSNSPVVEQAPQRPQVVAAAPIPDPVPKSALPRESRAPVAEPVIPSPPPAPVAPAPVTKAAPPAPVPAPISSPVATPMPAPVAVVPPVAPPPAKVAAIPQAERAPPVEAPRPPEPVKTSPAPPPAVEARPAPVVSPPPTPAPAAPARQADLAPSPAPVPPPPAPPAARPVPPLPPAAASRAHEAPRVTRWAPVRRLAGFGHDALIDQLEDPRRTPDDVPCLVMRELAFKAGTAQFGPKTPAELQTVAKVLTLFPGQPIEIGSKLGPGRPMASDAKLRADRTRAVRDALVGLGVAGDRLLLDPGEAYERVAEDVVRTGAPRVQSIGLCVRTS